MENGNNKYRRDLRGVSIEDFTTTIDFIEYKFQIDGLDDYKEVIDALRKLLVERDKDLLSVIFAARETTNLLPGDVALIQTQHQAPNGTSRADSTGLTAAQPLNYGRPLNADIDSAA